MDLVNERGLLIDLDMAKDLQEPEDASKFDLAIERVFPVRIMSGQSPNLKDVVALSKGKTRVVSEKTRAQDSITQGSNQMNWKRVREPITVCSYIIMLSTLD